MKKEKKAGNGAGKRFCVFLAVLFFFAASTTGSLYLLQQTYGLRDITAKWQTEIYESCNLENYFKDAIQISLERFLTAKSENKNDPWIITPPIELDAQTSTVRFRADYPGNYPIAVDYPDDKIIEKETLCEKEFSVAIAPNDPSDGNGGKDAQPPFAVSVKPFDPTALYERFAPGQKEFVVTLTFFLTEGSAVTDSYSRAQTLLFTGERLEPFLPPITAILLSLSLLCCFLALRRAWQQGRQTDRRPDFFSLVPPDLYLCCVLPAMLFFGKFAATPDAEILTSYIDTGTDRFLQRPLCMSGVLLLSLIFLLLTAYSLRRGGLRCLFALTRYERIPFARRTVAYLVCIQLVKLAAVALYLTSFTEMVILFLLLEKVVTLPVIFRALRQMRSLMDNTAQFVQGDLSGKAAGAHDYATIAQHGADIDSIAQRISLSADEYIQSSNFKAELITNLSHDIKTPLTSIINYTQLLSQDGLSDADKARYLSVLQRHSSRLQKLIEDLTDVSDAATGKVKVTLEPVDLGTLVPQSALGFEERLQKRGITLRFVLPEEPVFVSADQRLLWRVADNLMNNICKYARDDSEVQIAVIERDGTAAAIYRNVSAHELTLSGKALMERFVRADSARSSDGSGLGLSIAYSLMQLQGGKLALHTEGDEFTAQILFRE